jgi:hypothetical protein
MTARSPDSTEAGRRRPLLLNSALSVVSVIAFVVLFVAPFVVGGIHCARWRRRSARTREQVAHLHAKMHLQDVQQTVTGAQLLGVRRVISSSLRATRAVVLWTATETVHKPWFTRACAQAGDSFAIAGADPSNRSRRCSQRAYRAMAHSV